jgi:hypothetical protein
VLSNTAEVVAAVLAVSVTVVAIVVELAATRYSHEITRLFLREPVNMAVLGLLVLVPYICFLFRFLSPISVIERICRDAYRIILNARGSNVARSQRQVQEAIDELQDVARSAIQQGDRGIAMLVVDALADLLFDYVSIRVRLPQGWFPVTESVAIDLGPEHPHPLELARRSFNSDPRVTIGARDPRTAYYLMNLYRMSA